MSKIITKQNVRVNQPQKSATQSTMDVVIADSTLQIEIAKLYSKSSSEVSSEKVPLMEYSAAYW